MSGGGSCLSGLGLALGAQPLLLSPVGDEGGDRAVVLVLCVCALAALLLGVGGFPRRGALC